MSKSNTRIGEGLKVGVAPAECVTGGAEWPNAPVYVTGTLGYDFGTYARRDAFEAVNGSVPLLTNTDLSSYLLVAPFDADAVIWTLSIDNTPVYALRAAGTYAKKIYQQLQAFLIDPNIDLISVAGRIADSVRLLSGQVVPVIEPDYLGFKTWSSSSIVAPAGQLAVTAAPITADTQVYLTGDGSLDWSHWGLSSDAPHSQKISASLARITVGNQILQGDWVAARQTGYTASFRWNDGTPPTANFTPDAAIIPGYLQLSTPSAFTLTVPADTNPRILRLYVRNDGGPSGGSCRLTANLTGFPAPRTDETFVATANQSVDGVYTIAFQVPPGTPGTPTLSLTWQPQGSNSAGLQAATLEIGTLVRSTVLRSYLDRIYFELRNMGVSAQERALNYAASYAITEVLPRFKNTLFGAMFAQGMVLDGFEVKRAERCRPGGDCWDVLIKFFHPGSKTEWSRPTFRIYVDVSQVKPLNVAQLQHWNEL